MAELSVDDIIQFTGGRLEDTDETQAMLDAALLRARRYCGWHVCPVRDFDVITMDGPGGTELFPPTRNIVELTEVVNDGVLLEVGGSGSDAAAEVLVPADAPWKIVRTTGVWSTQYRGIELTLTHGYTESQAADWRQAVLSMVSQMASTTGRADSDLIEKTVDMVTYRWGPAAEQALFDVIPTFNDYELRPVFLA